MNKERRERYIEAVNNAIQSGDTVTARLILSVLHFIELHDNEENTA